MAKKRKFEIETSDSLKTHPTYEEQYDQGKSLRDQCPREATLTGKSPIIALTLSNCYSNQIKAGLPN